MDCTTYRAKYSKFGRPPLEKEVWQTEEYNMWVLHFQDCIACSDWTLGQRLAERGIDVNRYPCVHIANQITHECEKHADPFDCPDVLVIYNSKYNEYGIPIRDGGSSFVRIYYCPWCGTKLGQLKLIIGVIKCPKSSLVSSCFPSSHFASLIS